MRKKSVLLLTVFWISLLCSCGNAETPSSGDTVLQHQPGEGQAEADGTGEAETDGSKKAEEDVHAGREAEDGTNGDGTDAGGSDAENGESEGPIALSEDEILFFTEFIQKTENYGFLLSAYDDPEDVDLGEVFYSGAGIAEPMSDEEIGTYLTARGQEELFTDCVKVPAEAVDAFLGRKLGIGLEDIGERFAWFYLPEYDSYYHEAGDTNYTPYDCVEGVREGELYTLRFHTDWDDLRSDCETVLRKNKEEYQFVSNRYLGESESAYGAGDSEMRAAYAAALQNFLENQILPDGTQVELDSFWEDRPNENEFCIADVDGDGTEELLIALTTTYVAGMVEEVYEYDPDTREMRKELQEFPYVTYFDNGMILAGWSHNHTYGEDLWPYNMYQYDSDSDEYLFVGSVTSWQKAVNPEGYPDDVDVSGTGTVYAITYGGIEDYCYDQQQYDAFYEETFGTADEVELQWSPLTQENLDNLLANL